MARAFPSPRRTSDAARTSRTGLRRSPRRRGARRTTLLRWVLRRSDGWWQPPSSTLGAAETGRASSIVSARPPRLLFAHLRDDLDEQIRLAGHALRGRVRRRRLNRLLAHGGVRASILVGSLVRLRGAAAPAPLREVPPLFGALRAGPHGSSKAALSGFRSCFSRAPQRQSSSERDIRRFVTVSSNASRDAAASGSARAQRLDTDP